MISWRIEWLLGKNLETDKYSRFYAAVEVLLDYNNWSGVFCVVRAEMLQAGQFEATS
jgi:hypothetical protein